MPRVSVLMPVYNAEQFLKSALESILEQSYVDFELLAINDGSTDSSLDLLKSYSDHRIRIIGNTINQGYAKSLNRGIREARGQYIARQDADDISHPERLAQQVAFLDENPRVGLLGSAFEVMHSNGSVYRVESFPQRNEQLQQQLLIENCFCHPTVMIRDSCFNNVGCYNERSWPSEDHDLWLRIAEQFQVANLAHPLLRYRRYNSVTTENVRCSAMRIGQDAIEFHMQRSLKVLDQALVRRRMMAEKESRKMQDLSVGYISTACRRVLLGFREEAIQNLQTAIALFPTLAESTILESTVVRCMTFLASGWSNWRMVVDATLILFECLSEMGIETNKWKSKVLSQFYCNLAFESNALGLHSQVRSSALRSWIWMPNSFSADRGLVSIFAESLIGRDLMDHVRMYVRKRSKRDRGS